MAFQGRDGAVHDVMAEPAAQELAVRGGVGGQPPGQEQGRACRRGKEQPGQAGRTVRAA